MRNLSAEKLVTVVAMNGGDVVGVEKNGFGDNGVGGGVSSAIEVSASFVVIVEIVAAETSSAVFGGGIS